MRKVLLVIFLLSCKGGSNSGQIVSIAGKHYSIPGDKLISYPFPFGDSLITTTYLSVTHNYVEYNDCLCDSTICDTRLKVWISTGKLNGCQYSLSEIILNHEKGIRGYNLHIFDPHVKDPFINTIYLSDGEISETPSSVMNIICRDKDQADKILKELNTFVTINLTE